MLKVHIPPELDGQRPHIQRFFDAMVFKLAKNAHKGTWEKAGFDTARKKLSGEIDELDEAMANGNVIEIILEAADVANFALILADIAIRDASKERNDAGTA